MKLDKIKDPGTARSPRDFFGAGASRVVAPGSLPALTLTRTVNAPGERLPRHSHDEAFLSFLVAGEYEERDRHRADRCRRFTTVFHPEGDSHAVEFGACRTIGLQVPVPAALAGRLHGDYRLPARRVYLRDPRLAALMARMHLELNRDGDDLQQAGLEQLVLEIFTLLPGNGARPDRGRAWFRKVCECLRDHPVRRPSLAELAHLADVHPVYLSAEFRRRAGCTVGQFVRRERVNLAIRKLMAGDGDMAGIALECGFSDQSHLIRAFRNEARLTPGRVRALLAGK